MIKDKKLVAFFAGFSAFIAVFENFIPLPFPFLRLGFSNIPIMLGLNIFNFFEFSFIVLFKTVFSHLFRGTLFSVHFLIGISGAILFIIFLYPTYKLFKNYISFISAGILGAFFHNTGQILVALLFIPLKPVLFFGNILIIFGTIFGLITGIICNILYNKNILRIFYGSKTLSKN
mgnify:CR=1 FL=1